MKVNDNVVKDLAYQEMIYNPLPGIAMNTYEPSTLAVGNSTLTVGGKK